MTLDKEYVDRQLNWLVDIAGIHRGEVDYLCTQLRRHDKSLRDKLAAANAVVEAVGVLVKDGMFDSNAEVYETKVQNFIKLKRAYENFLKTKNNLNNG